MHNAHEGVESVAELIARLVCDHEARQAAKAQKKSNKSLILPLSHPLHLQQPN